MSAAGSVRQLSQFVPSRPGVATQPASPARVDRSEEEAAFIDRYVPDRRERSNFHGEKAALLLPYAAMKRYAPTVRDVDALIAEWVPERKSEVTPSARPALWWQATVR